MKYHLSVPWSALLDSSREIALADTLLNREIESVVAEFANSRLKLVTPRHFNVGINIEPVVPSNYSRSGFGYEVDGQSVQSKTTQFELKGLHFPSFCGGPNWVINNDTGIHSSAAGYQQMALRVPPPAG